MAKIEELRTITHKELPGVKIYPLSDEVDVGMPQEVLVEIEGNGMIPLHEHSVDATMIILNGSGEILSSDPNLNGKSVEKGAVVYFERGVPHGFIAGLKGLLFISKNGGIVSLTDSQWDIAFSA